MRYQSNSVISSVVEKSLIVIILLCFSCQPKHDLPTTINLNENWEFKKVTDTVWNSATVPGNVFSDLLHHQLIEDPFVGNNEEKVQWVSETDWEYKTTFSLSKDLLEKKHFELNFDGLDTYASVYLNDSLILKANNAFRKWEVDIKPLLKAENELRLVFESTSKHEAEAQEKLSYELPEGERIFTRKAQFQYGWDWGPKLNTNGIWRPIKLVAWNDFKILDAEIMREDAKSLDEYLAVLSIVLNFNTDIKSPLYFDIYVNDSLTEMNKRKSELYHSSNHASASFYIDIDDPKLWWPHNLGEPYLYDIKVVVKDGRKILDSISTKYGIRDIELVTEKDSIGESFYFKVNNVPVYAKGANYIPQHSFQNEVKNNDYERLLSDVVNANMNMLRVWGGGIYENDIFYDLCDEKGILVWQDFMFACAMYPGDDEFRMNVINEALDNLKRLRNHPSIALWCGNNESSEGWNRWGWQADRSEEEKEEIWENYKYLFDRALRISVGSKTDLPYWQTSPKYGRGNPLYKSEGDAHDWWIWHDGYPFEHLEENVPRFMSEFGFQSFPSYEVIQFINQKDSVDITSKGFKNHQKHSRGFQIIETYMQRDFPVPDSAEDYVYMSQLVQAYGITKGIEAHRRAKPYNMGALYWQLNDCWPAVSWSSIDYFGNWKALHYKAKRSFENVLVSSKVENNILKTWVVNDKLDEITGQLTLNLMNFSGEVIWSNEVELKAEPLSSEVKFQLDLKNLDFNKGETVLVSTFNSESSFFYFVKPKDLKLNQAKIQKIVTKTNDGFSIELYSSTLQKDVFLYTDAKGDFSDNFFDLMPNEPKTIQFQTKSKSLDSLQIKTFNTFIR